MEAAAWCSWNGVSVIIGTCCCGGGGCCGCISYPKMYETTVEGVTAGTCSDCETVEGAINNTHPLQINYFAACAWGVQWSTGPCGGVTDVLQVDLTCDATDFILTFRSAVGSPPAIYATYKLARSSWVCLGSNVMSLLSNDGSCATWPATLTVLPV